MTSNTGSGSEGHTNHRDSPFLGAIALVKPFTGLADEVTLDQFVISIETAANLTKWTDEQQVAIVRLRLTGPAAECMKANNNFIDMKWSEVKKALMDRFGSKETRQDAYHKLRECAQSENESIAQYAQRIQILGGKCLKPTDNEGEAKIRKEILDEQLLSTFIQGLQPRLKRFVATHCPKTLTEAIAKAEHEEQFAVQEKGVLMIGESQAPRSESSTEQRQSRKSEGSSTFRGTRPPQGNREFVRENGRGRSQSRDRRVDRQPNQQGRQQGRQKGNDSCHRCGKRGHWARDCRQKQPGNNMRRFQYSENRQYGGNSLNANGAYGNRRRTSFQ